LSYADRIRYSALAAGRRRFGGDDVTGDNLTPGFPLGWNEYDWRLPARPVGIQLMTRISNTDNWYWVTWEVNTPAYFHFIAGTTTEE